MGEAEASSKAAADSKKRRRRKKKKKAKPESSASVKQESGNGSAAVPKDDVEIEYVSAIDREEIEKDPTYSAFAGVFEKFMGAEELFSESKKEGEDAASDDEDAKKDGMEVAEGKQGKAEDPQKRKPTKKERKVMKRERVAVLKQLVEMPEVVEVHDVNSADPELLVALKSLRNTVPVPKHWSQRRKYLQGKRGLETVAYELPEFIQATGIDTIRSAVAEKDSDMRAKQKQRERVTGKMGKIDIDYQVLYDAFFRHQTKPKLTTFGDLYYEGKENEIGMGERKPGIMSRELREALGMGEMSPPPWLVNMQRHGPPPSYPKMRIPGLNAPLPPGAEYGYHTGGWGKPPVDENGQPLYGDVFGVSEFGDAPPADVTAEIESERWGELEDADEDEEEESSDEEEEGGAEEEPVDEAGMASFTGSETPETMNLRKEQVAVPSPSPKALYQVLPQVSTSVGAGVYGSAHKYQMPGAAPEKVELFKSQRTEKMDVTLNPGDFGDVDGLTEDLIRRKYQEQLAAEKEAQKKEDVSDIIAAHTRKRKAPAAPEQKSKKYKF